MSCLLIWEQEMVSLAAYLATIRDPIMVVVYKHLQLWAERATSVCFLWQTKSFKRLEVMWRFQTTLL